MPHLYCEKHGREHEASTIELQDQYRQFGESVLVVSGTLIGGLWQCDRCNATLGKGDRATLVSAFPRHSRDDLYGYDFGYELYYFAMSKGDTATAYGAPWPDDSISDRRIPGRSQAPKPKQPLAALDFLDLLKRK